MPELPEVETTCRGIQPFLENQKVVDLIIRQPKLRWPITKTIIELKGNIIHSVRRRGKYILLQTTAGSAILHLGMSGSLRLVAPETPFTRHDHVDIILQNNLCLRFTDPRRFGALLWTVDDPLTHPLLLNLGPEPLTKKFNADYLYQQSRHIKRAIKLFIMDNHIVTGIGNIYANEALFLAKIDPRRKSTELTKNEYANLVTAAKKVLRLAIQAGGTTLRDFRNSDGKPGYFKQQLYVYGRENQACFECGAILKSEKINQRATTFCCHCQV